MHTLTRISRILTALILATMLLPPAPASAAVEPASIQGGRSKETVTLVSSDTTLRLAQDSAQSTEAAKARAMEAYGQLPLFFIPNQGQVDKRVGYYVQSGGQSLWFTTDGVTMALPETTLRLEFLDANPSARLEGGDKLPGIVNFFIGNDSAKWRTNIPTYGRITYRDLWPGVDLTYESRPGALKSTFTIAPGADPAQIRLAYPAASSLVVDRQGNLIISAAGEEMRESAPLAWQEIDGRRVPVAMTYQVTGQSYGFALLEGYDLTYPLVIDPELAYSTFLGGSGGDGGWGIAVDGAGNAYVTGDTGSTDFPTASPYQGTHGGGTTDAFVAKIDTTQSGAVSLIYSTYLGGSGDWDRGYSITVDEASNAYVTGWTESYDFPTTTGAFDTSYNGWGDAFVVKLNATGSVLIYSTYLGGSHMSYGNAIAVDGTGSAYVAGVTYASDFPTTAGAFDTSHNGSFDAFVVKVNASGTDLAYATFLGGSSGDQGNGIAVDGMGNAYVMGWTVSTDFPTVNPYQAANAGWRDTFVTKLNAAGSTLTYSTYLGGSGDDYGQGIAVDGAGCANVTGYTYSTDFPIASPYQGTHGGGTEDAFVAKIDTTQSGAISLIYSTYLGGSGDDHGQGIAVDGAGSAYVTGRTNSSDFPTTAGAFDTSYNGNPDVFMVKVNAAGTDLTYATFLGGSSFDYGYAIAVDGTGNAYVTGSTGSSDFPTRNPYQEANAGNGDAFVTKFGVLSIGKSAVPNLVAPGGLITYTIVVSETGDLLDATGVQVTDTVPANTACCASIGQGGTLVGDDVTWSGLTISKGQSISLTFVVTVGQVPYGTKITNDAYRVVTSTQGINTGLGSAVTTTVAWLVYLPIITKSY